MNNKLYKLMNWPEIEEIIYSDGDDEGNVPNYLYRIFSTMEVLYSDGEYIYAKCKNACVAKLFDGNDDLLDARLKKTQAQYRAYLERNAAYIKDLEEEERDAANVILKIKLNPRISVIALQ